MGAPVKVRWLFQRNDVDGGVQLRTLCVEGKKYGLCVTAGHPVRVLKRPLADVRRARLVFVQPAGTEYPVDVAARTLAEMGKSNGITDAANALLRYVLAEGASTEVDEHSIEDEESLAMTTPENTTPVGDGETTNNGNGDSPEGETTMTTKNKTTKAPATKKTTKAPATKVPAKKAAAPAKGATKAKAAAPAKGATKAKAAKVPRVGKRAAAKAHMSKRLESVKKETTKDLEWRAELVRTTSKECGVSEISCRSILRKLSK